MNPHGCEVQLLAWSNSSNGGPRIVLQLADEAALEYFQRLTMAKGRGKTAIAGQRLMAGFQEIGDDEQPAPDAVLEEPKDEIGPRCKLAVMWSKDPKFGAWLQSGLGAGYERYLGNDAGPLLRAVMGIESRRELDTSLGAGARFDSLIRYPYQRYLKDHP